MSRKIIIIAGPNGAGKTTFARVFLPEEAQCPRFINADLIAAGLSPFAPEAEAFKAGRLMLSEIASCTEKAKVLVLKPRYPGWVICVKFRLGANAVITLLYSF